MRTARSTRFIAVDIIRGGHCFLQILFGGSHNVLAFLLLLFKCEVKSSLMTYNFDAAAQVGVHCNSTPYCRLNVILQSHSEIKYQLKVLLRPLPGTYCLGAQSNGLNRSYLLSIAIKR